MTQTTGSVSEYLERRELAFLLEKGRVRMLSSIEDLSVGDMQAGTLKEGDTVELPRWVGEELVELKLAEDAEGRFEDELFRAVSREKLMSPTQLSTLPKNFYMAMKRRMGYLAAASRDGRVRREDYDRVRAASYDLVGMRLGKLLSLSSSTSASPSMAEKLTPEETAFFRASQTVSKEWKAALLGGT